MSTTGRTKIWVFSIALPAILSAAVFAAGGGGHGGGMGGGGMGGGGMGGGHMGGGYSGGYMSSGFSGGHMNSGSANLSHGYSGQAGFSHGMPSNFGHDANFNHSSGFNGQHSNWNQQHFNGNQAWNANHGVWNHGGDWWHHHEPDRDDFFRFGFYGWPWFAFNWGPGYWWPNYYDYCYAPYGDLYGSYGPAAVPYVAAYPPGNPAVEASVPPESEAAISDFYIQGIRAFRQGDYANATRLAGHAAVDDPRNQNVHILTMLGLLAMGEYRGAAMEAHAVAALGKLPDWPKVYAYYGDVDRYTEQLRKLEKWVHANKSAPEGRFLLGFQYSVLDHKEQAKDELLEALKLTPRDPLAAQLLTKAGGEVPADIAKQLAEAAAAAKHTPTFGTDGDKIPDAPKPNPPTAPE
jgi:tetratricopeptide (TPR) repeat protein